VKVQLGSFSIRGSAFSTVVDGDGVCLVDLHWMLLVPAD
jgi:hypothetical protein